MLPTSETELEKMDEIISIGKCEANMTEIETEIVRLKQQYSNELASKCFQLKIHRTTDLRKTVQKFYEFETQPVLNRIKLIENQWRTLDLWEIVQAVNPRTIMAFEQNKMFQSDRTLSENPPDNVILRMAIVLCCFFEDLMRSFSWKVGDTLNIENDICNTVGKLIMQVTERDIPNLLKCLQCAMMNIQANSSKQDRDKLRSLLITKKKYNGLNLACILLEQMILDNKDNSLSWMRIVCTQFIDLVCQLIIEPDYQEDVHWTLNNFLKLESSWPVRDIYNFMRNGILMFQYRQEYFHRYLIRIRNFAVDPSMIVPLRDIAAFVCSKRVLYVRDDHKADADFEKACKEEKDKSLDQIFKELDKDEVGQDEQDSIKQIVDESKIILEEYKDTLSRGIERESNWIRNSTAKNGFDVLSSCLAVTSMALFTCKKFWPSNTQLVSYCLLVARKMKNRGRLLEILTGEGKSCIIAMVAATYALLGRTVDIVTSSPVLSQRDAEK